MALNTVSSDRLATNVKNTNFTAAEKQDLTDDIKPLLGSSGGGNKNKIFNGDFAVDQRHQGAEVNPAVNGDFYPDRWSAHKDQANKFKIQRVSDDAPEGFKHALKCTVVNTHNPTGGNYFYLKQSIEGNNTIDLDMGKSTAKKITVSFFVKSSVTGVYSVAIRNNGYDCSAVGEYTISSANTWEKKTINFLAATSIGTWLTNNSIGIRLEFVLGAGSTYQTSTLLSFQSANKQASTNQVQWINNAGATFLLTGVQLEKGDVATEYDHESFNTNLLKCQRYFQVLKTGDAVAGSSSQIIFSAPLFCPMRATPSAGKINLSGNNSTFEFGDMVSVADHSTATPSFDGGYHHQDIMVTGGITGFDNLTTYRSYKHEPNGTTGALITASAEL